MMNQDAKRQAKERIQARTRECNSHERELKKLKKDGGAFDWTKVEAPARLAERARRLGMYEEAGALLLDPSDTELGSRIYERILDENNLLAHL